MNRVGVIGGGQLAWMMAVAAKKLGIQLVVQTPQKTDPAVAVAFDSILAAIDDVAATSELANRCDVITFENEFVNLEPLFTLAKQGVCFRPSLSSLVPLLDKYDQRCYLRDLGLPVPKFIALGELESLKSQVAQIGFPLVLKARRHGYDGQGTFIIKDEDALKATLEKLGKTTVLLEEFIPFERELAAIAARSVSGEIVVYPIVETQQEEQVCRRVLVPAGLDGAVISEIEAIARTILDSLQVVGLFGIELFLSANGQVLVNEVSPRTHNSGHFTLDACETSQFEMHLRAVCGLPLGNSELRSTGAVMVNLLGYEYSQNDYLPKRQQLAQLTATTVHWYGKTESRPGRKLGHVTALLSDGEDGQAIAQTIESIWYSPD